MLRACHRRTARLFSTATAIDAMLQPPRHLPLAAQLERMQEDDGRRGRRPFQLPDPLDTPLDTDEPAWCSWGEYFCRRGWEDEISTDRLLLQTLSGALTCPLTAWSALRDAQWDTHTVGSDVHVLDVHVVGAADSMEGALLRSGWVWEELVELLPPGAALRLALVGPALSECAPVQMDAHGGGVTTTVSCHRAEYLEWRLHGRDANGATPAAPGLVLGFNSGAGTDAPLWREAVQLLLDEDSPLVFTSFDEVDADADAAFFDDLGAKRSTSSNPWASAMPESRTAKQGEAAAEAPGGAPLRVGYANAFAHRVQGDV